MSLQRITARHECDCCGKWFEVSIDPAYTPPAGWSMHDVSIDRVRGGHVTDVQGYSADRLERALGIYALSCSVQGDQTLCGACTKAADQAAPDCEAGQ